MKVKRKRGLKKIKIEHNRKVFYLMIIVLVLLVAVIMYALTYPQGECKIDNDCVKDRCCHAKECVPINQSPDCTDVLCTMDCKPDTMDCGGGCKCIRGVCVAQIP